jgi:tetratricopeptide (TPR) repeat protein
VTQAISCPSCGAKVRAGRAKCPRCRTRIVLADPAVVAARSRRLQRIGLTALGVALLAAGAVWLLTPRAVPSRPAPAKTDPLAARRPAPASADEPAAPKVETERPFMDDDARGYESYHGGDFEGALAHYQDAVVKNPQDAEALSNLGQVLVRLGRTEEALPYFDRAIQLNPERWSYVFNRARAAGLLGRWDECVAGYRRAQELFPDDYATTFNLALALHKSGDEAGAVEQYQKAIALAPEDASFRLALATSLDRLNRGAEAASAYQEYLRLSPSAADADKVRARIAQLTGAPAEATPAPAPASRGGMLD